jgi:hypothetical protein
MQTLKAAQDRCLALFLEEAQIAGQVIPVPADRLVGAAGRALGEEEVLEQLWQGSAVLVHLVPPGDPDPHGHGKAPFPCGIARRSSGCPPESQFTAKLTSTIQVPDLRFKRARGHRWERRKRERNKEKTRGDELMTVSAASRQDLGAQQSEE